MQGTIDGSVQKRDVMVPMRDGVRLATDVTLPARGGKPLPGPFPTLVFRTPYDKGGARPSEISAADPRPRSNAEIADELARAGFAVLAQDCRGRYRSEGVFQKYIGEGEDGYDTLAWARQQDWCNGRFGTFGLSYSAHVQTALALTEPEGLDAMFLDSGGFWNAYQGGVRRGGAFELKQATWAMKHAALSPRASDPLVAAALAAEDVRDWFGAMPWRRGVSPLRHVPEYEDYLFDQWEHGAFDEYWQRPELFAAPHYDVLARPAGDVDLRLVRSLCRIHARALPRHHRSRRPGRGGDRTLAAWPAQPDLRGRCRFRTTLAARRYNRPRLPDPAARLVPAHPDRRRERRRGWLRQGRNRFPCAMVRDGRRAGRPGRGPAGAGMAGSGARMRIGHPPMHATARFTSAPTVRSPKAPRKRAR